MRLIRVYGSISLTILLFILTSCNSSEPKQVTLPIQVISTEGSPRAAISTQAASTKATSAQGSPILAPSSNSSPILNESAVLPIPDSLDLLFSPIDLNQWNQDQPIQDWESLQTISLGEILGKPVTLHYYKEHTKVDEITMDHLHGVLNYGGKSTVIMFYDGIYEDMKFYPLQKTFQSENSKVDLIGAIGTEGTGLTYLVYDESKKEWFNFHEFGTPQTSNMDHDGVDKIIIVFAGMHLQWPDVELIKWNQKNFEIVSINSMLQKIGYSKDIYTTETYLEKGADPNQFKIMAYKTNSASDAASIGKYTYESGRLIRK
ncbi:MAG: hypothetical protein JWM44_3326 [Bacilli bacterium]|nr:hypothetical protein [Bacilli bacterium]